MVHGFLMNICISLINDQHKEMSLHFSFSKVLGQVYFRFLSAGTPGQVLQASVDSELIAALHPKTLQNLLRAV